MSTVKDICVPDIGTVNEVAVIEVLVKVGDSIQAEQSLITLESEKASMEIPSPEAGVVESVTVKVGDKIKTGAVIVKLKTDKTPQQVQSDKPQAKEDKQQSQSASEVQQQEKNEVEVAQNGDEQKGVLEKQEDKNQRTLYASPVVRRLARELNIDLGTIVGTGKKDRIQKEDLLNTIKAVMQGSGRSVMPVIDFNQFGETETKPLSKIKKLTASNLHRNWTTIPHVTQFDEADITELEAFRKTQSQNGHKFTPLVFIMKAVVAALKQFPQFNASLDAKGENLIFKKYFHIGVAVDTPEGLVVPVIRDVDQKNLSVLAQELADISQKARNKQLLPRDMQGSTFTISSLGGIGGTAFTPIVNFPDAAILGVSKACMKPVYQDGSFVPRLMLPLSLSYDHRIIDGAEGARFIVCLSNYLSDVRLLLL